MSCIDVLNMGDNKVFFVIIGCEKCNKKVVECMLDMCQKWYMFAGNKNNTLMYDKGEITIPSR